MGNSQRALAALTLTALFVVGPIAGSSLAGKASSGAGPNAGYTGSFSLVLLDSTDGVPHFGQKVTFNVSSNAAYPEVNLTCYQNGDWVTNQTVGFYPGWPWSRDFPLSSWKWTGGAADCNAKLFYQTKKGDQTLSTMSLHVEA